MEMVKPQTCPFMETGEPDLETDAAKMAHQPDNEVLPLIAHFPHPPLSQSVFAEFCEPKWSFFIHKSGKLDLRSPIQFSQTPKIRSVTVQGAECGLKPVYFSQKTSFFQAMTRSW
jgi:hypothetical protein